MADLEKFRAETRAWLEANCPPSMRTPMVEDEVVWGGRNEKFRNPDSKLWLERMAAHGWTAPTWPKEYGGGGLSKAESACCDQELKRDQGARRRCFRSASGCSGRCCSNTPTKSRRSASCRRSSAARSAGARAIPSRAPAPTSPGLQTKCEDKGDHWLINGQKVWTSYANYADWFFCLVRTDTTKKHEGISFVLIDMTTPGRRDAADQADLRLLAVLRDLLHRREGSEGPAGRHA